MAQCLIRYHGNKLLNIKRCFMYMKKDKNGKEDWEELNCKEKSEC